MKKSILLVFGFLCCQFLHAQDSIISFKGEIIQAKVIEVSPKEIRYKRFDYQDGPTYVVLKSDVKLIRYSNGVKEEFQPQLPADSSPVNNSGDNIYYESKAVTTGKIQPVGNRFVWQGSSMSESGLHQMLLETKDKRIAELVQKSKNNKGLQYIGFAAIPAGILALSFWLEGAINNANYNSNSTYNSNGYGSGSPYNTYNTTNYTAIGTVFFVVAVACPIGSAVFHQNRKKYNLEAIRIYNDKYAR